MKINQANILHQPFLSIRMVYLFVAISFFLCSVSTFGQSKLGQTTNLKTSRLSIPATLHQLAKNSQIEFAFSERFFDPSARISIAEQNRTVEYLLEKILADTHIGFKEIDGQIVLYKQPKPILRKYTISGFIEDASSGERLIAAAIFCPSIGIGTTTNEYGFYSLTVPEDAAELVVSYLGYQEVQQSIALNTDLFQSFKLNPSLTLSEIIVTPNIEEQQLLPSPANEYRLIPEDFKAAPDLGGESDLMRIAQLLPGVQTGADGFGGFHVRGGNADQNLILLDGVPVYNPDHLLGIFSVFNTDAVKSARMYRGSMPARYGGRVSSVFDVRTKEGNNKKWAAGGAIDFISEKGYVEGPFANGKGSMLLTGRSTHSNYLLQDLGQKAFFSLSQADNNYSFYDLNFKMSYRISESDRIYLSFYKGSDSFEGISSEEFEEEFDGQIIEVEENLDIILDWGNTISSLRWNHVFTPKLFANTTLTYSQYEFSNSELYTLSPELEEEEEDRETYFFDNSTTDISDAAVKTDFDLAINSRNYLRFGGSLIFHRFIPESVTFESGDGFEFGDIDSLDLTDFVGYTSAVKIFKTEASAYVENEFRVHSKWNFNAGLRMSTFQGESNYFHISPRLMANYHFSDRLGFKASLTKNVQYLHRILQNEINLPDDIWIPSDDTYEPQVAWQTTLGLAGKLSPSIHYSLEGYYKTMEGVYINLPSDSFEEDESLSGNGDGYGLEVFIKKNRGKTGGWLSYTWSKSNREFVDSNEINRTFVSRFDRRHDLKLYLYHRFNNRWNISLNAIYGSPLPLIYDSFQTNSGSANEPFPYRQTARSTPYHRVDLSMSYFLKTNKWDHTFKLSLYNLYNRENPAFYRRSINGPVPVNLLSFLPGFYYSLQFKGK